MYPHLPAICLFDWADGSSQTQDLYTAIFSLLAFDIFLPLQRNLYTYCSIDRFTLLLCDLITRSYGPSPGPFQTVFRLLVKETEKEK